MGIVQPFGIREARVLAGLGNIGRLHQHSSAGNLREYPRFSTLSRLRPKNIRRDARRREVPLSPSHNITSLRNKYQWSCPSPSKLLLPMIPKLHLGLFSMRGRHRWVDGAVNFELGRGRRCERGGG